MQSCARISKDTVSICGGCMEVKVDRNPALDEGVGHGGSLMCLDPAADVGVCHGGSLMCHGPPDAGADYGDSFMCHDPAIKLFGRDIPLVSALATCIKSEGELTKQQTPAPIASIVQLSGLSCQQDSASDAPSAEDKEGVGFVSNDLGSSSGCNEVYEEENLNQSSSGIDCSMPDGEVSHGHLVHDKVIKKPDKLIPCPRCNSMETKFCYFNNYNVNQPRHFCKKCQRYWTAGGTLRNVPVGAGRRKSKHSMSHHKSTRHVTGIVQAETSDLSHQKSCSSVESTSNQLIGGLQQSRLQALPLETCSLATVDTPARSVLNFGHESPFCESMSGTSLSIHQSSGMQTRGALQGQNMPVSDMNMNNGCSSRASISLEGHIHKGLAEPSCTPLEKKPASDELGYFSSVVAPNTGKQVSSICGETLRAEEKPNRNHAIPKEEHLSVNFGAHQRGAIMNQDGPLFKFDTDRGSITPSLPPVAWPPGGHWTGVSWPLMPMTMWGPPSDYAPFPWNMTWGPAAAAAMAAAAAALTGSAPPNAGLASSPIRKHKLEGSQSEPGSDGCLWVPKTLRVHDPIEAARSSIWATLGLGDGPKVGDAENIFCFKSESKVSEDPAPHPQHVNPAALARSMAFQESR